MDSRKNTAEALNSYISTLLESYKQLLEILNHEAADIAADDENSLSLHVSLELETVNLIISVTKTIQIYLENTPADEKSAEMLKEVESLKIEAAEAAEKNIMMLKNGMDALKRKIQSIKLPKSARKVYYSGNNPTLMDIKI